MEATAGSGLPPENTTIGPGPPAQGQLGFFESLRDTRFNSLITPKLIRFLYIVSAVVLAIGAIVFVISGFAHSAGTGVITLIVAPIIAFIYLILVRLYLELIVVAFKIRDAAERVAENTSRQGA
jgi:uncharacterized membrane protein